MKAQSNGGVPAAAPPQIVVASLAYPPTLPIIALPKRPLFPKTASPLVLADEPSIELVTNVVESEHRLLGLVLARRPDREGDAPAPGDAAQTVADGPDQKLYSVGVVAQILKTHRPHEGGPLNVLVGGLDRFTIDDILMREPQLIARVTYHRESENDLTEELRAHALAVINSIKELVQLNPLFQQELKLLLQQGSIEEPGRLADYAAYLTTAKGTDLQAVLETFDVPRRL
ncbi:MAG: LON peptidase substrate-binding domain-containing protein, partial [Deltaproteobacteria bacterium]|nr:LON peptidase substrate-binding domain-containing protein [Deltaproteobacteria bacterium]